MATSTITYTAISATEVQAQSPLVASLASRWAYNPLAIAQGAAGAQRIYLGAWERLDAGDVQRAIFRNNTPTGVSAVFVEIVDFVVDQGGTLRFKIDIRGSNGGAPEARVIRTRNTATTTFPLGSTSGTTYETFSADLGTLPGDQFSIEVRNSSGSGTAFYQNLVLATGGADIIPRGGLNTNGLYLFELSNTALT